MQRPNQARVVVMGEELHRRNLTRTLTQAHYPVREAATADECVRIIADEAPEPSASCRHGRGAASAEPHPDFNPSSLSGPGGCYGRRMPTDPCLPSARGS